MRILEKCTSAWPMADMQHQIDALREAFSADMRKPFVLKPSFPYGSPGAPTNTTPKYRPTEQQNMDHHHAQQAHQVSYPNHPISPPISAGGVDTKSDSPAVQSLVMMATGQRVSPQQQQQQPMAGANGVQMADSSGWNPAVIFEYVSSCFLPFIAVPNSNAELIEYAVGGTPHSVRLPRALPLHSPTL
jgi:hypothetical protein